METRNKYVLGEDSQRLLDVLNSFMAFQNKFAQTLYAIYGETQGEQLYLSHFDILEPVENAVMGYLREQFTMQMGTGNTVIEI